MRPVALKHLCAEITRGTAPTYADGDDGSALAVGQSCVRPDGAFDAGRGRHHAGPVPSRGRLRGGEVLINSTGTGTLGRVGYVRLLPEVNKPLFADGHVTLLRSDPRRASGRFLAYVLGLPASRAYIEQALSAGATKQQELNLGALRNHKIAVPNLESQQSIADFLDRECARISELGAELAALEATTQDWRTLIFSRVTSEFPRIRLRFAIMSIEQGWSPPCEERQASDEEWGVLKLGCVNHGSFTDDHKVLPSGVSPRPELEVRSGDVLMSRANTRQLVGSCAVVTDVRPQLMLSDLLYRLRIAPTWDPEYVALGIGSHETRQEIRASAAGSSGSMPKLNHGSIKGLTIPASDLSGQRTVVREVLDGSRAPRAVLRALPKIRAALAEYRDALITEAVTGKLDVTNVSESQMAESLEAVREGERPEVLSL